jgi:uncharacterized iron-regulated membrane protein
MTLRRLLFWAHLVTGVAIGLVMGFLAVTGSILAFQPQIIALAERGSQIASPATSTCVAPSVALQNAADLAHRLPGALTLFSDPHRPGEVSFGTNGVVLVNSCTGQVIGSAANRLRSFFAADRDLHRWVALNGVRHEWLRSIKNACVLAFLFLIVSGLILWFPRKLTWKHLRPAIFFRPELTGRAREWNWHNVFGFWMALPLATIACTGIIMAYPWANALLFRAAGDPPPAARPKTNQPVGDRAEHRAKRADSSQQGDYSSFDVLIQRAILQDPQWKTIEMRFPAERDHNTTFQIDEGDGGQPQLHAELVLSNQDARVVRWQPFSQNARGRRWRGYVRFLHTGEIFGLLGRSIAFLAVMSLLMLVWTGGMMASRRFLAARRRKTSAVAAEEPVSEVIA